MRLFEYQAKDIFREAGIPAPEGILVETPEEALSAAGKIGYPCVLKSQVLMGGRGKKGLIPFIRKEQELLEQADRLFASEYDVSRLLLEKAVEIDSELFLSISVDPAAGRGIILVSTEGGVEIETLAQDAPSAIHTEYFSLSAGLQSFQISDLAYRIGIGSTLVKQFKKILSSLYTIFVRYDAELVEINPLFVTTDNILVAGDGKLMIDENSMSRQKRFVRTREYYESDMEFEAAEAGIPYLQFNGDISLMCAGAGLTTTVFDLINYEGGSVANYLEFGGPNYRKAYEAMELCLKNDSKVILVVTFGTIARADVMAQGIVDAAARLKPDRPIVTCIRGTGEAEAVKILEGAGLEPLFDTEEAVRVAVHLSKGSK